MYGVSKIMPTHEQHLYSKASDIFSLGVNILIVFLCDWLFYVLYFSPSSSEPLSPSLSIWRWQMSPQLSGGQIHTHIFTSNHRRNSQIITNSTHPNTQNTQIQYILETIFTQTVCTQCLCLLFGLIISFRASILYYCDRLWSCLCVQMSALLLRFTINIRHRPFHSHVDTAAIQVRSVLLADLWLKCQTNFNNTPTSGPCRPAGSLSIKPAVTNLKASQLQKDLVILLYFIVKGFSP